MRFERKGSGAILWVGDAAVKASCAGRHCSMSALQKRLGDFAPAPEQRSQERPGPRAPEPLEPASKPWQQFIGDRARHAAERAAARDRMAERQRHERRRAVERHRRERAHIFIRTWKGQGDVLTRSGYPGRSASS
jgi:hypothetical protein